MLTAGAAYDAESCAFCGTPFERGQEYCLECGSRLVRPQGPIHALGSAWRRRLGWYPGDWIWPSLAALVIAAGGGAATILATTGSPHRRPQLIVATTLIPPAPATAAEAAPAEIEPPLATASKRARRRAPVVLDAWPDGPGYTLVLASLPITDGIAAARAKAEAALRSGLPLVGIIESSRYAGLHPGYYVVFSGVYGSLEDAQIALPRAVSRFPAVYARQIVP